MTRILFLLSLFLLPQQVHGVSDFSAICYHDVKSDVQGNLDLDQFALSSDNLLAEFEWLKVNGFHPISIDDLIDAQNGRKTLPEKAVLLTFDDGYISFYTKIFPLLRLYNYPAVLALVGRWLDVPKNEIVEIHNEKISGSNFVTWAQVKEMQDSGLVEIASHTYDLHFGIQGNPQDNKQPAAVTRHFMQSGRYESDDEYKERILTDLEKNSSLIEKHINKRPRVMVWPYGAYSEETIDYASTVGLTVNLTLDDLKDNKIDDISHINRDLIMANPELNNFAYMLHRVKKPDPVRMVHVDLDYVYDPDLVQQNKNLDLLIERIKQYDINTVYLQAFADSDGSGNVDALYFPNRHLPMRADLFNRVSWQLETKAGVNVYAWMPVLAFDFGDNFFNTLGVKGYKDGLIQNSTASYKRLSPFSPKVRKIIKEIYADLAKHTKFSGLLFHDDAYLTDYEDFSADAIKQYAIQGVTASPADIIANPNLSQQLAEIKTDYLISFTNDLADTVRYYQPDLKTARNMYALPALRPESELWFAQNLLKFIDNYDTTAIMAMPYMEKASDPDKWLAQLLETVKRRVPPYGSSSPDDNNFNKVLFELQATDWEKKQFLNSNVLAKHIRFLLENNVNNIGYYPDDFLNNQPKMEIIKPIFSMQDFPFSHP